MVPKIGETLKVWLPGESPWADCIAILDDETWEGQIKNILTCTAKHGLVFNSIVRFVPYPDAPNMPWQVHPDDLAMAKPLPPPRFPDLLYLARMAKRAQDNINDILNRLYDAVQSENGHVGLNLDADGKKIIITASTTPLEDNSLLNAAKILMAIEETG